ncbi:MAG: hypothetical protein EZS28_001970 [Streblomastix strix]|uniref:Uncharacterized protein n=1 Tax=Streblomastix strix TaxID=222440 RepID=A0A5J4X5J0_9EUKA|nr:MAG: hypothetical protein EZS28_001970 [Streblomastix strix]
MKLLEGQPLKLEDVGRIVWTLFQLDVLHMFVYYFTKRHPDEKKIIRTSPREFKRLRLQYEDVRNYINIQKDNIHGILAVLISNIDENAQDISSYGADRAKGRISVCAWITLSRECIKPLIITKDDITDEDLLHQAIVQGKYADIYRSRSGNQNNDLFVRWLKECYFLDLEAKRVAIQQKNALAIQLTDNCEICIIDEVKKLLGNQLISWGKTKLTPSQSVLEAFDALQIATSIKTTKAAFRIAGIDFKVVRGIIVAKIDVQRFENIIKNQQQIILQYQH